MRRGAVRAGNGALCRRCAHTSPTAPPRWESLTQMEPLIELCRRRGFVYPCSDIYGGMANTYDYGPLGAQLRQNLRRLWWRDMVLRRADTVQLRPRRNSDGLTEATKSKMRGKPKPKKAPASEPASRVASRPHSPLAITRVAMHGMYATKAGHLGL